MKSLSKKAAAFVLVLSSVAVAAGLISKEEVNKKVAAITAPYNDANTQLSVEFTDLNIDAIRTLDFGMAAHVAKKGPFNELDLTLSNAAYHYGDGSNPTVTGQLVMKLDLVKLAGQDTLNGMAADFEDIAKEMASSYTEKYGEAVTVHAKLEDLLKDDQGNVVSAKLHLAAAIDFNKLPAEMKAEDVEFKDFAVEINAGRAGIGGSVRFVMNPLNKSFQQDQPGLREFVLALLNEDAEVYQSISKMAEMLNELATSIVNHDPSEGGGH